MQSQNQGGGGIRGFQTSSNRKGRLEIFAAFKTEKRSGLIKPFTVIARVLSIDFVVEKGGAGRRGAGIWSRRHLKNDLTLPYTCSQLPLFVFTSHC